MPKRLAKKKLKVKIKQKQKQKQTQIVNVNITGRSRRTPAKKAPVKVEQPIQQIFRVNEPNYPTYRFQEPMQQPIRIQEPAVAVPAVAVAQPNRFEAPNVPIPGPVIIEEEEAFREVELQFRQNPNNEYEKQVLNPDSNQWVKLKGTTGKKVMKKYPF